MELLETPANFFTHLARTLNELFFAHDVDRRQRRGARQRIAAIGAAQSTDMDRVHDLGSPGDGAQWKSPAQGFRHGDEIGLKTIMFRSEEFAGPAESGLDLVGNEKNSVVAANLR